MDKDDKEPKKPSLDVLQGGKSKSKHTPRAPRNAVSRTLYDQLVDQWLRGERSVKDLSRRTGVSRQTCRKAINFGWPDRGWRALKDVGREHDQMIDSSHSPVAKLTQAQQEEAATWAVIRRQHLDIALAVRSVLASCIVKLKAAVESASANTVKSMRRTVMEEVLDSKGNVIRRFPRTVVEDVEMAPDLMRVASALSDAASTLARTGTSEIGIANSKVPEWMESGKKGWSDLSDDQLKYMNEHGKLPEGLTIEMLNRG